jgi:hypothetical protein
MSTPFPSLPDTWEPTRATLHAYAHAVGVVPRLHAIAHPKWWHVSLKVRPSGLVTDAMPLPGGGSAQVHLDLINHLAVVESSRGTRQTFPLNEGLSATMLGERIIGAVGELGLNGDYDRGRFENDEPRPYDEATASLMFGVFTDVATVLERHRAGLDGPVGPVQLWPHGFDLAVEWFGTRTETYEEDGEVTEHPSQLNLGFYAAGETYFYSNPWPFEGETLTAVELPHGAAWHTEGWEGSMLPYAKLADDPAGLEKLADYARAVFEVAAPTLS